MATQHRLHRDDILSKSINGGTNLHPNLRLPRKLSRASPPIGGRSNATAANSVNGIHTTTQLPPLNTSNPIQPSTERHLDTKGKWAYAYLMAGVDPDDTSPDGKWYHGILFNVLVSAEILHRNPESPSQADVILMVQFSQDSRATKLPPEEEAWLQKARVKIKYLPPTSHGITQTFYTIQLEKFRILEYYREYSRILFLDGDVMPHCNLDYLFELSERGWLKENVVLAWRREPVSGGFFMLTPHQGDYEALQNIIQSQQRRALETGVLFDPVEGWGHKITPPDSWLSTTEHNGTLWDWYGDFVDQGLLYFWVKYFKMNASIIVFDKIQQWGSTSNESPSPRLDTTLFQDEPFTGLCPCRPIGNASRIEDTRAFVTKTMLAWPSPPTRVAPYRDFVHFSGPSKPWTREQQRQMNLTDILHRVRSSSGGIHHRSGVQSPQELWQYTFWKVFQRLGMHRGAGIKNDVEEKDKNKTLVSRWKTFRKDHRLHAFHERLENIREPKNVVFPTHRQALDVIRERFGQEVGHIGIHKPNIHRADMEFTDIATFENVRK